METDYKATAKPSYGLRALHYFFALIFAPLVVIVFVNWIYVDVFTRREMIVKIEAHEFQDVITDQGSFNFPELSRPNLSPAFHYAFWNDLGEVSRSKLVLDCRYKVVVTFGGLFEGQPLGQNRAPPFNTIVKVLGPADPGERSCDVSANSGKPVCTDDQVRSSMRGIPLASYNCDFETYWKNKRSFPNRLKPSAS